MRITIIGSGNLGYHLAKKLNIANRNTITIVNPSNNVGLKKLKKNQIKTILGIENIPIDSDVYIICVKDNAIKKVADALYKKKIQKTVLHTSGATASEVLKRFNSYGVLYPLQTFKTNQAVNWKETPLFLEYSDLKTKKIITKVAKILSEKITYTTSEHRLLLHLCAVLVNNFTNAIYHSAYQLLGKRKKEFDYLLPIIHQTLTNIEKFTPDTTQTGPAIRKDKYTIDKHLKVLSQYKEIKKIYLTLTQYIQTSL